MFLPFFGIREIHFISRTLHSIGFVPLSCLVGYDRARSSISRAKLSLLLPCCGTHSYPPRFSSSTDRESCRKSSRSRIAESSSRKLCAADCGDLTEDGAKRSDVARSSEGIGNEFRT